MLLRREDNIDVGIGHQAGRGDDKKGSGEILRVDELDIAMDTASSWHFLRVSLSMSTVWASS